MFLWMVLNYPGIYSIDTIWQNASAMAFFSVAYLPAPCSSAAKAEL